MGESNPEVVNPVRPAQLTASESKPDSVSRRGFLYRGAKLFAGAAAAIAGIGTSNAALAQGETKPPSRKPDVLPASAIQKSADTNIRKAESAANLAKFDGEVDSLVESVQKALPPGSRKIKTVHDSSSLDNVTYPVVSPQSGSAPEIFIYTQDDDPDTLEAGLLLTGEAVGHVLNRSYDDKFAAEMSVVYHDVISHLSPDEKKSAEKILSLNTYLNNPKEETQNIIEQTDEWAYARAFSLARLKSSGVLDELNSPQVSPKVKEGVSLILLTAVKSTTSRLSGQIPPGDLGFNTQDLKSFEVLAGNKIKVTTSPQL